MNQRNRDGMVISILNNHCVMCDCGTDRNPFISLGAHCEGNFEGATMNPKDICDHPMAREAFAMTADIILRTSNIVGDTAFKLQEPDLTTPRLDCGLEAHKLAKNVMTMVAMANLLHDTAAVPWYKSAKFNNELAAIIAQVNSIFNNRTWPLIEYADQIKKDHIGAEVKITFTPKP